MWQSQEKIFSHKRRKRKIRCTCWNTRTTVVHSGHLKCCEKFGATKHFKTVVLWLVLGKGGRSVPPNRTQAAIEIPGVTVISVACMFTVSSCKRLLKSRVSSIKNGRIRCFLVIQLKLETRVLILETRYSIEHNTPSCIMRPAQTLLGAGRIAYSLEGCKILLVAYSV